jgi:methionine synthase I (cobalamin-dependent)
MLIDADAELLARLRAGDEGDPVDLGRRCAALVSALPNLNVFGGCCGTDHRHVSAIATAVNAP